MKLVLEVFPIWQQALASSGCEKYLHSEQKPCLWAALGRVVMLRYFWGLLPSLTRCSATSALGTVAMPHWGAVSSAGNGTASSSE